MSKKPFFYHYHTDPAGSLTHERLEARRQKSFDLPVDRSLFLNVGHFITWYSGAEAALTLLLYFSINNHPAGAKVDPEMFHLLSLGMDAKVKTQRLKEALEMREIEIPADLKWRLNHFVECIVPIRNRIVHGTMRWVEPDDLLVVHKVSDFIPWLREQDDADPRRSYTISGPTLYEHGVWLNCFANDLGETGLALLKTGKAEIALYHSMVPMDRHREMLRRAALATPSTPAQTTAPPQPQKSADLPETEG